VFYQHLIDKNNETPEFHQSRIDEHVRLTREMAVLERLLVRTAAAP
jgi:hypothetical protein